MGDAFSGVRAMLQGVNGVLSFGVVVPVRIRKPGDAENLQRCLDALLACDPQPAQIVVVDDGSETAVELPGETGVTVVRVTVVRVPAGGPARARNAGAAVVAGDVMVFVDADICVPVDTFARFRADFERWPGAKAVWGTVTAEHPHPGWVSQYKNLAHRHFTLQQGEVTQHLTSMLVAVRREAWERVGGFDAGFERVSVEDVELGRSLHDAGLAVYLDRELQAEHRHRFDAWGAVRNDFRKGRAMASATLARRARGAASVRVQGAGEARQVRYLVSVPLGVLTLGCVLTGRWRWAFGFGVALAWWERDFLRYLAAERGLPFAMRALPWMAVERTTIAAALIAGTADHVRGQRRG